MSEVPSLAQPKARRERDGERLEQVRRVPDLSARSIATRAAAVVLWLIVCSSAASGFLAFARVRAVEAGRPAAPATETPREAGPTHEAETAAKGADATEEVGAVAAAGPAPAAGSAGSAWSAGSAGRLAPVGSAAGAAPANAAAQASPVGTAGTAGVEGFAELYVSAYLEGAQNAVRTFYPEAPALDAVREGDQYVARAAAVRVRATGQDAWAVTVGAEVLVAAEGGYRRDGIHYFEVGIARSGDGYAATALPSEVWGPPGR